MLDWIKEREAWAARHAGDGSQFPGESPTLSNIAGVVAAMKWGVILDIGESAMKDAVMELVKKREGKQEDRAWDDGLSSSVATGIENKVEEYNEDILDGGHHPPGHPANGSCSLQARWEPTRPTQAV